MHVLGRRMVTIVLAVLLLGSVAPGLAAAAPASDPDTARVVRAVQQIATLERERDINTLFDLLHPDVRTHLSREGLAAYYASPVALIPDGPYRGIKVSFGAWTWPVTGKRYARAATVTYTVTGTRDGTPRTEKATQHLVLDGGDWRWFFGITDGYVERQDRAAARDRTYTSAFDDPGYAAIDTYWAHAFAIADIAYAPPRAIIAVTGTIQTGCGVENSTTAERDSVYYCTMDGTIYYSPRMKAEVAQGFGDFAWYHIVAHEWGHHVQQLLGIEASRNPELDGGMYPVQLELQADCLAGTYAQDEIAKGGIKASAFDEALAVTAVAGDRKSTKWDDPQAHGTGTQRSQSVLTGFDDGFLGCDLPLRPPAG